VTAPAPYPPLELASRVGSLADAPDPFAYYDALGRAARDGLQAALPEDWQWDGKRVLDFGCGAGRTLRQWLPEAERARFTGCDIDVESVRWLQEHLSPPFTVLANDPEPPLALSAGSFDLIYALSVFTHLTGSWSRWLLELHRLLDDGGLLLATFMGPGIGEWVSGEPWDEERTGMFAFREGQSWDFGGPMVMHSEWWIAEHWGRAFDVIRVDPAGFSQVGDGPSQGIAVLRKRAVELTPAELEWIDPANQREASALARNLAFVQHEIAELRQGLDRLQAEHAPVGSELAELARLRQAYERVVGSRTWTLTAPLRSAAARARRLRG
jgi:SAM-dependent methyltransferase